MIWRAGQCGSCACWEAFAGTAGLGWCRKEDHTRFGHEGPDDRYPDYSGGDCWEPDDEAREDANERFLRNLSRYIH